MDRESDPSTTERPRMGEFAGAPGAYRPVVRLHNQAIDPGEELVGEVFFTGYGEITLAKLDVKPSPGIFDDDESRWWSGMSAEENPDGSKTLVFGGTPHSGGAEDGVTIHLTPSGVFSEKWGLGTIFFDKSVAKTGEVPQMATESKVTRAPVDFRLATHRGARPGTYTLRVVLTYFDGQRWQTTANEEEFSIRNILDRWQGRIVWTGAVAAVSTIILAGAEVVQWF